MSLQCKTFQQIISILTPITMSPCLQRSSMSCLMEPCLATWAGICTLVGHWWHGTAYTIDPHHSRESGDIHKKIFSFIVYELHLDFAVSRP